MAKLALKKLLAELYSVFVESDSPSWTQKALRGIILHKIIQHFAELDSVSRIKIGFMENNRCRDEIWFREIRFPKI